MVKVTLLEQVILWEGVQQWEEEDGHVLCKPLVWGRKALMEQEMGVSFAGDMAVGTSVCTCPCLEGLLCLWGPFYLLSQAMQEASPYCRHLRPKRGGGSPSQSKRGCPSAKRGISLQVKSPTSMSPPQHGCTGTCAKQTPQS